MRAIKIIALLMVLGLFTLNGLIDIAIKQNHLVVTAYVSVEDGDVAKLSEVLRDGADPNNTGGFDETLLHRAQTMVKQYPGQANRVQIVHLLKIAGAKR